jgi:hypothetical protein
MLAEVGMLQGGGLSEVRCAGATKGRRVWYQGVDFTSEAAGTSGWANGAAAGEADREAAASLPSYKVGFPGGWGAVLQFCSWGVFFHFLFQSVHESVDPLCTVGSVPSNGWRPGGLDDLIPRETLNTILSQILMINLQEEVNHTSRKMAIGTGSKEALVPVLESVLKLPY